MVLGQADRYRSLERYRVFFRITGAVFALGLLMFLSGVVRAFVTSETTLAATGLLLVALSGLNGYKVVHSTMRIIEEDANDNGGWQGYA